MNWHENVPSKFRYQSKNKKKYYGSVNYLQRIERADARCDLDTRLHPSFIPLLMDHVAGLLRRIQDFLEGWAPRLLDRDIRHQATRL